MAIYRKILWILCAFTLFLFPPFSFHNLTTGISADISVTEASGRPSLNYSQKSLLKGETVQLKLKNTKGTVKFSSRNKKIASVSSSGQVKAKSAGTTVITAFCSGKTYRCRIRVRDTVDLIVFAGQSNMTGRGNLSSIPKLPDGAGYESRTVTHAGSLSLLKEPFGIGQDRNSLNDSGLRTGSMVTAFVQAYYQKTQTPVVAVSATIAGSGCVSWSTVHYKEAGARVKQAQKALKKRGLKVENCYLVFMQGENDGFAKTSQSFYKKRITQMFHNLQKVCPVEKCLLIRIGSYTKEPDLYKDIVKAQTDLCRDNQDFVLVSVKAASFKAGYYQEDGIHLTQKGLNILGKEAGANAASYKLTGKEPELKDPKYKNTYKPAK